MFTPLEETLQLFDFTKYANIFIIFVTFVFLRKLNIKNLRGYVSKDI